MRYLRLALRTPEGVPSLKNERDIGYRSNGTLFLRKSTDVKRFLSKMITERDKQWENQPLLSLTDSVYVLAYLGLFDKHPNRQDSDNIFTTLQEGLFTQSRHLGNDKQVKNFFVVHECVTIQAARYVTLYVWLPDETHWLEQLTVMNAIHNTYQNSVVKFQLQDIDEGLF